MPPFTRDQFIAVFAAYNEAVWPAQVLAYALGAVVVLFALRPSPRRDRLVAAGLALLWAWTGIAYHALHFAPINPAAYAFGALFVLQALLLAQAAATGSLRFGRPAGALRWLGIGLVVYAMALYPLLGRLAGHSYPGVPTFGITPCPLVLFTFGIFLLAAPRLPRGLLVVPFVWALIGGSAAALLAIPQDWMLLASVGVVPLLVLADRRGAACSTSASPPPTARPACRPTSSAAPTSSTR
jgi:hypothetical protein